MLVTKDGEKIGPSIRTPLNSFRSFDSHELALHVEVSNS